jgi:hypothetical protein
VDPKLKDTFTHAVFLEPGGRMHAYTVTTPGDSPVSRNPAKLTDWFTPKVSRDPGKLIAFFLPKVFSPTLDGNSQGFNLHTLGSVETFSLQKKLLFTNTINLT